MKRTAFAAMMLIAAVAFAKGKEAVTKDASDMEWKEIPNTGGVKYANLWGDILTGAHGAEVKFAAGTEHPLHTHTADMKLVVLSGKFKYGPEGADPKSYGPGSYVMVPGHTKHVSGCEAGADCILVEVATAKIDMKPVKAPGAPAAKAGAEAPKK